MTLPPDPEQRRRLSGSIPWYLATGLIFLVGAIMFAVFQQMRPYLNLDDQSASMSVDGQGQPAAALATVDPQVTSTVISVPRPNSEIADESDVFQTMGIDALNDPTMRATKLENGDRINILLLGTDGRDEEYGPPRTDLMMLIILNRNPQRVTIISIPRDLWVPIYGHGEGKINTAYFLGSLVEQGPELAKMTVEDLVGLPIHHIVQIDFNGFRTLIDEMGGIMVNVPEEIDDPYYPDNNYGTLHLQIAAGRQLMDGELSLRYARTRYGGTDQGRSSRQQAIIMGMREKALTPAQLAKAPFHLRTVYNVVESDLSLGDFFALAHFARTLTREQISMHTISGDLTWSVLTWNGQDALLYDPDEVKMAIKEWSSTETAKK